MTRIKARYGKDGYSIASTGHAGTNEACTAVSAIIGALAGWVHNNTGSFTLEKGKALVMWPKGDGGETAMEMAVIGLRQVAQSCPDDVTIELIWE